MPMMMVLSLLLNIIVLTPVCTGLIRNADWVRSAYGEPSPARSILLAVYLAIAAASVLLLIRRQPAAVAALLFVQVVYKFATPITVGTLGNPVVVSNLVIAGFHTATLTMLWRSAGR